MLGRFVWRVKCEHRSVDDKRNAEKPLHEQKIIPADKQTSRREILTLGLCPYASDVPTLAAQHVLGEGAKPDDWYFQILSIEQIGWAQGFAVTQEDIR